MSRGTKRQTDSLRAFNRSARAGGAFGLVLLGYCAVRKAVSYTHLDVYKRQVHATFPLAQAAQAHAMMESGENIGKIILTV